MSISDWASATWPANEPANATAATWGRVPNAVAMASARGRIRRAGTESILLSVGASLSRSMSSDRERVEWLRSLRNAHTLGHIDVGLTKPIGIRQHAHNHKAQSLVELVR